MGGGGLKEEAPQESRTVFPHVILLHIYAEI